MLKVLDLFSGIGGFSLGLERTGGFETVAFCEIEEYPRKVLRKHWPEVPIYEDVRELTAERLAADGITPDIITGGFPCQDISVAGKQAGITGERSGLWSECARLLREIRPKYAIFENVPALLSGDGGRWIQRVLWDIAEASYDAELHCISASEIGAWHKRDRVWIIAYPEHDGLFASQVYRENTGTHEQERAYIKKPMQFKGSGELPDTMQQGLQGRENPRSLERNWQNIDELIAGCSESLRMWDSEPELGRVANGIPDRSHRLKGLGNAVVPQIPELIGRAILECVNDH